MDRNALKDALIEAGINAETLKDGVTVIFIDGKSFSVFLKNDSVIMKQKGLFSRKYRFSPAEFYK